MTMDLKSVATLEKELFSEWARQREGFVCDGVVSEDDYQKSKLKICFILKEVNDPNGGEWDLRDYLSRGGRSQTWTNITRWTIAIQSDLDINWKDIKKVGEENRKNYLKKICAMNLKKSPGGHTLNRHEFNTIVDQDRVFIQKQYGLYKADLTICCGTGWDFRSVMDLQTEVNVTKRGIKWFHNEDGKPVIMYSHPAARVDSALLLYGLLDAVNEVLKG